MMPSNWSQHGSLASRLENDLHNLKSELKAAKEDLTRLNSYAPKRTAYGPPEGFDEELRLAIERYERIKAKIKGVKDQQMALQARHPEWAKTRKKSHRDREALRAAAKASYNQRIKDTNTPLTTNGIPVVPYRVGV